MDGLGTRVPALGVSLVYDQALEKIVTAGLNIGIPKHSEEEDREQPYLEKNKKIHHSSLVYFLVPSWQPFLPYAVTHVM